ncbi:MAG: hypothetical protein ACJ8M1_03625 [Chthoniobacterales bacterium]
MPEFIDDAELDRQLHEVVPYIDDGGFTARVIQALPGQNAPSALRHMILIVITLVGTGLAYVLSGGGRFVDDAFVRLVGLPMSWLFGLALVAGMIVGAVGLAAAVAKAREPGLITR